MEKVFDKILIEFLIPSLLMFACILLVLDIVIPEVNLTSIETQKYLFEHPSLISFGVIFSYILTTSSSAIYNFISRIILWGKIREFILYKKLDIFKENEFEMCRINLISFLIRYKSIRSKIDQMIKSNNNCILYHFLIKKIKSQNVPDKAIQNPLDIYEALRTLVMASQDNAIISWINYHWSHLRLARSTLVPAIGFMVFTPWAILHWGYGTIWFIASLIVSMGFFIIQFIHYYYRERFMMYSMVEYYLIKQLNIKKQKRSRKYKY